MKNMTDIKRAVIKLRYRANAETHDEILATMMQAVQETRFSKPADTQPRLWRIVMKSRYSKMVTAAALVLGLVFLVRTLQDAAVMAAVKSAMQDIQDVHVTLIKTFDDGRTEHHQEWLKGRNMYRSESPDYEYIDDGTNHLDLHKKDKTAQYSDSWASRRDFRQQGQCMFLIPFRGDQVDREHESPYRIDRIRAKETQVFLAYQMTRIDGEGPEFLNKLMMWVDRSTNLPYRLELDPELYPFTFRRGDPNSLPLVLVSDEILFDYSPIPVDTFSMDVPDGYTLLSRKEGPKVSGRVIDEQGRPVPNAYVQVPGLGQSPGLWTDEQGVFEIKCPDHISLELPFFIRAFVASDPNRVAWTIIRDPEYVPAPRSGEYSDDVFMDIQDEEAFRRVVPHHNAEILYQEIDAARISWIKNVELTMQPALVKQGQIVNRFGKPVKQATVRVDFVSTRGWNHLEISSLADLPDSLASLSLTDDQGRYTVGHLPILASADNTKLVLNVAKEGSFTERKEIDLSADGDFVLWDTETTTVVRGRVVDDAGAPLCFREVDIDLEDGNLELPGEDDFITDVNGFFEVNGLPPIPGMTLEIRVTKKPYYWDKRTNTKDLVFAHYNSPEIVIPFKPDQQEYWLDIVIERPNISFEVTVKDREGRPLPNIPVGLSSGGSSNCVWFATQLVGVTDTNGVCIIKKAPRSDRHEIWICQPMVMGGYGFDNLPADTPVDPVVRAAVQESLTHYQPVRAKVILNSDQTHYQVSVVLMPK